jgi:hypothetical protein
LDWEAILSHCREKVDYYAPSYVRVALGLRPAERDCSVVRGPASAEIHMVCAASRT